MQKICSISSWETFHYKFPFVSIWDGNKWDYKDVGCFKGDNEHGGDIYVFNPIEQSIYKVHQPARFKKKKHLISFWRYIDKSFIQIDIQVHF